MPYRVAAAEALARWRVARAQRDKVSNDSPEWQAAYVEEQLAKAAYQDAIAGARGEQLPEPPPWPEHDGEAEGR